MSLPPLLSHAYNTGTEEVVRRGKKIFHGGGVQLLDASGLEDRVRFRVRNDQYNNYYTVTLQDFSTPEQISVRCQCPYNMGDICRHEVAALFQLNDMVQSGFFEGEDRSYDQSHTVVRLQQISQELMVLYTGSATLEAAVEAARDAVATLQPAQGDTLKATVPDAVSGEDRPVTIQQTEARYYHTSCTCEEEKHPLCIHKAIVFLQAQRQFGAQFFQRLQNYDTHKNKLLDQYGYSLTDDLSGKFEFFYQDGKPFLRVLDATLKKITAQLPDAPPGEEGAATGPPPVTPAARLAKHFGILIEYPLKPWPHIAFGLLSGVIDNETGAFSGAVSEEDLNQYIDLAAYPREEQQLAGMLRKMQPAEVGKWLKKNMPFGEVMEEESILLTENPTEEQLKHAVDYLHPKWMQLAKKFSDYTNVYKQKTAGKALTAANLQRLSFSSNHASLSVSAAPDKAGVLVKMQWLIEDNLYDPGHVTVINQGLVQLESMLYFTTTPELVQTAAVFLPKGNKKIAAKAWPHFLRDVLKPLFGKIPLKLAAALQEKIPASKPHFRMYLQEQEGTLTLQPAFLYGTTEVKWGHEGEAVTAAGNVLRIQARDEDAEEAFLHQVQNLHTEMRRHARLNFFYLPAAQVLADNWFFHFIDSMRDSKVEVLGQEGLRQLRISPYRPQTSLKVSSGIDWFDAELDLVYGDQRISISEVKKALSARQQYVSLADGSLGLLPEEWLKKHALLIKMGEGHGKTLRLKKTQFSVLDQLLGAVDETKLADELEQKKVRLQKVVAEDTALLPPPLHLDATLRPYQQSGYQWLNFLKDAGWGGILADDMGLGKTVQALAFFQQQFNDNPGAQFMVVCPTTLVYNWEAEVRRFTPKLSTLIHHGPKRDTDAKAFTGFGIIITTYGTMRSDILMLKDLNFDAVVLDESQAIKNPSSQVAKASLLLNAKNRFALSGTPVQNNTFDLYAQLNFLNPGLLGSREFFQNEFATPIDKFGEVEVRDQLRQLTYPFILRRSKEQVAKDLPPKTEAVLYCEMGDEQRKIYDAYRNDYRAELLGMIDTKGMEKSQFHILQGLTKLRQICDSPAILNEEHKYPNHSVKLEELVREISENVGDHKALIFSQFLGMLALIRSAVIKAGIDFAYFDGSASTMQRETAIKKFQNNEDCRVFLISLKAGGIGLNLTAADYVYIVDPWWNPAVEQQAIDRTHRIGQTKSIVAYRMICKDTIEEKILLLQERKRQLASGLITDDTALMKKLTRDDISFLLS